MEWVTKTRAAVKDRLVKEISYWDHRAAELQAQEQAGKPNAKLNSQEARRRADDLQARLEKRMAQLDLEGQISALPPVMLGAVVVVPVGLIAKITGREAIQTTTVDTQAAAAAARAIVMQQERELASSRLIGRSRSSATTSRAACPAPACCGSSRSRAGCPARTRSR
jgi:hypothetical protein